MAAVALLGIEISGFSGVLLQGRVVNPCVVETVTIAAIRRIHISLENGFRMARSHVFLVGMTGRALLDGPTLDIPACPLPAMNVPMAVDTAEILLKVMEIGAVFPGDLLVTGRTGNGRGLVLPRHVAVQVPDVGVTAPAAIAAVDRRVKGRLEFRVIMAALAGPRNGCIGSMIEKAQEERQRRNQNFST